MSDVSRERLGYFCAFVSAALFGLMPLFTKIAYQYGSNPHTVAFMRFFYTAVACGLYVLLNRDISFSVTKKELSWLAFLAVFYAGMALLLYGSYEYIDSVLATAIHFSFPVVVMLLSVFILHIPLTRMRVICAALCMSGMFLITGIGSRINLTGAVFAFLSGVSLSLYIVLLPKSGLEGMPLLKMVFWLSLFTAVYLFVFATATGRLLLRLPFRAHVAQCMLALCCTLFAMTLFQKGVFLIGGVRASLLSTLEPIVSVAVGVTVFHEVLTVRIVCGIVLILLSAALLVKAGK